MPRVPSQIVFECEACGKRSGAWQVRRKQGRCRRCRRESWTLAVYYVETEAQFSGPGTLFLLLLGFGWFNVQRFTSETILRGVPVEDARRLTEKRKLVSVRVSEYVRLRTQQELRDCGARACSNCEMLFVPTPDKPWSQQGYCSKSCAVQDGVEVAPQFESAQDSSHGRTILVTCPNGHTFAVLPSFSGLVRPCTDCGAKTPVP